MLFKPILDMVWHLIMVCNNRHSRNRGLIRGVCCIVSPLIWFAWHRIFAVQ